MEIGFVGFVCLVGIYREVIVKGRSIAFADFLENVSKSWPYPRLLDIVNNILGLVE